MRRRPWGIILVLGLILPCSDFRRFESHLLAWGPPTWYELGAPVVVPELPDLESVWLGGRPMTFLEKPKVWIGVAPHGSAGLVFWFKTPTPARQFAEVVIPVQSPEIHSATNLRLPAAVLERIGEAQADQKSLDRQILGQILNDNGGKFATDCWRLPIKSSITSPFGSPRRLPDGKTYHHGGEDRRASVGTPVHAAGSGRVAFAGEMVLPGRNVVLAHGEGWFSRYMHFSDVNVQAGGEIKTGQLIGKSGATGRVNAPHLHWEILWRGIPADPHHFLQTLEHLCDQG